MKKIIINREELAQKIRQGDNCSGRYYIVVSETGYKITWAETNRAYNPWGKTDFVVPIPVLFPDGSGRDSEEAEECIQTYHDEWMAIGYFLKEKDMSAVEYCEQYLSEDWEEWQKTGVDWLVDEFESALNNEPNSYDENIYYDRERKYEFTIR